MNLHKRRPAHNFLPYKQAYLSIRSFVGARLTSGGQKKTKKQNPKQKIKHLQKKKPRAKGTPFKNIISRSRNVIRNK